MSDNPSEALVASLRQVYLDSDTEIVPVLRALVASDEFLASSMQKVRTPVEDALATWTALGAVVAQPHSPDDAGNQFINVSKAIGQVVYDWPTPDAFPDVAPAWSERRPDARVDARPLVRRLRCLPEPGNHLPAAARLDAAAAAAVQATSSTTSCGVRCSCPARQRCCRRRASPPISSRRTSSTSQHAARRPSVPALLVSILDTVEHLSR